MKPAEVRRLFCAAPVSSESENRQSRSSYNPQEVKEQLDRWTKEISTAVLLYFTRAKGRAVSPVAAETAEDLEVDEATRTTNRHKKYTVLVRMIQKTGGAFCVKNKMYWDREVSDAGQFQPKHRDDDYFVNVSWESDFLHVMVTVHAVQAFAKFKAEEERALKIAKANGAKIPFI